MPKPPTLAHVKVLMTSHGLPKHPAAPSQDAFRVRGWDQTVLAIMADGVGGARAGREAAERTVETLMDHYAQRPRTWSPAHALNEFARLINQRLYHDSLERFGGPELVTTLCVAVVEGDRLFGLNVGDSRAYLARGGKLEQLSEDHTFSGENRHVLSRALGLEKTVSPFVFERALQDGDMALLCSDGVSNVLDELTLTERLGKRAGARWLVQAAQELATTEQRDDVSAIVLDIQETVPLSHAGDRALPIPRELVRNQEVDGFQLQKPFQQSDRVWLAARQGEKHTLKFAPLEAEASEEHLNAFIRETWYATRLNSPFFPRAFVPTSPTARYYAMEFIDAPTLQTLLKSRVLSVDEGIALGKFLLQAAQFLVAQDLVHGDIKPENILVQSGYTALEFKLIDFGSITELFSLTSRAGTASYLAPERFRESPIAERTEVYAIGATLYQALTGKLPYGEIERFQTPQFGEAKNPLELNANLPGWLGAVLLRATTPQPERRYARYSEMLFDLEHPAEVVPFHRKGSSLLERAPLRFYQVGFFLLLALSLFLLLRLLSLTP